VTGRKNKPVGGGKKNPYATEKERKKKGGKRTKRGGLEKGGGKTRTNTDPAGIFDPTVCEGGGKGFRSGEEGSADMTLWENQKLGPPCEGPG